MGVLCRWFGCPRLTIIPVCGIILWCFIVSGCHYSAADDGPFDIRLVEVLRIGEEGKDDGVVFGEISGLIAVDSRAACSWGTSRLHRFMPLDQVAIYQDHRQQGRRPGGIFAPFRCSGRSRRFVVRF